MCYAPCRQAGRTHARGRRPFSPHPGVAREVPDKGGSTIFYLGPNGPARGRLGRMLKATHRCQTRRGGMRKIARDAPRGCPQGNPPAHAAARVRSQACLTRNRAQTCHTASRTYVVVDLGWPLAEAGRGYRALGTVTDAPDRVVARVLARRGRVFESSTPIEGRSAS